MQRILFTAVTKLWTALRKTICAWRFAQPAPAESYGLRTADCGLGASMSVADRELSVASAVWKNSRLRLQKLRFRLLENLKKARASRNQKFILK
jgi:hypothetical protein